MDAVRQSDSQNSQTVSKIEIAFTSAVLYGALSMTCSFFLAKNGLACWQQKLLLKIPNVRVWLQTESSHTPRTFTPHPHPHHHRAPVCSHPGRSTQSAFKSRGLPSSDDQLLMPSRSRPKHSRRLFTSDEVKAPAPADSSRGPSLISRRPITHHPPTTHPPHTTILTHNTHLTSYTTHPPHPPPNAHTLHARAKGLSTQSAFRPSRGVHEFKAPS